ncbi:hypothetical protein D0Z00_002866 [Geotrichum galactomycetum]|uniref:Uncharacterized protein n=1 Tax=Geotrichum galactomycetum TaxID=27317 RepID=A0ACB6V2X2_9ASCO|nr:hypothetical protein D0Z00_002866 [Geotrichum candidum]
MCQEEPVWQVEDSIPPALKEQIEFLKNSPTLNKTSNNPIINLFTFLHIVRQLKITRRTGWVDFGIVDAESISDHMYRMGIISFLTNDKSLDTNRCVKIALVHDMAESIVGDITPVAPISKEEKHRREFETMQYLTVQLLAPFNPVAAQEIMDCWNEYENVATPEARFVKDVDKFELLMQCVEYERDTKGSKGLEQFLSVRSSIKTKEVGEWADAAIAIRSEYLASLEDKA